MRRLERLKRPLAEAALIASCPAIVLGCQAGWDSPSPALAAMSIAVAAVQAAAVRRLRQNAVPLSGGHSDALAPARPATRPPVGRWPARPRATPQPTGKPAEAPPQARRGAAPLDVIPLPAPRLGDARQVGGPLPCDPLKERGREAGRSGAQGVGSGELARNQRLTGRFLRELRVSGRAIEGVEGRALPSNTREL